MRRGDSGTEGKGRPGRLRWCDPGAEGHRGPGRLRRGAIGTDRPGGQGRRSSAGGLVAGLREGGAEGALDGGSRGEEGEEDARHFDESIFRDDSMFWRIWRRLVSW